MSVRPTPAVERAVQAWHSIPGYPSPHRAQAALYAALTNPDDRDFLARALFVLDTGTRLGVTAENGLDLWENAIGENARSHWRQVADGLRTALTGRAS